MIILLLFLAILHNGFAINKYYDVLQNNLFTHLGNNNFQIIVDQIKYLNLIELPFYYLGLNRKPVVDKNMIIPSAMMELYTSIIEKHTSSLPLPGIHTKSANTARTYINKGILYN